MTSETNDPIVDEIRVMRAKHAARFDYDVDAIVDYLQALQNVYGRRCVKSPTRDPSPSSARKVATGLQETD